MMAFFQEIVPNEVREKFFGLLTSALVSSQSISYGIMGLIISLLAPFSMLLFYSLALTATALLILLIKELKIE